MQTVRVKPCAVNSIRLVQWRKSRPPIFDRPPGTESASRDPAISPLSRRFSPCSGGRGTTSQLGKAYSAQRVHRKCRKRRRQSCVICDSRREGFCPPFVRWTQMKQLNPNSCCRSVCPAGCRLSDGDQTPVALSELFQDWRSTPAQSSVTVLRDLRQRMHVRFCEPPPDYLSLRCQEKRDRRSLSVDGAHSQFSDGDSYPYCGGAAKVARKAWLAGASLSDGFRRVRMCLRARGPAKTRMPVHVDG
jgi:hypothetical protein